MSCINVLHEESFVLESVISIWISCELERMFDGLQAALPQQAYQISRNPLSSFADQFADILLH
jgi:hypothetical protein